MLDRLPYVPCLTAWSTCPRAHVPNFSSLCANVPTCKVVTVIQLGVPMGQGVPVFQLRLPKVVPIFQLFFKRIFQFLNFLIMLNISKFQEYLSNFRKLISSIVTRNGKIVWKHGRLHRNLFGILKFTKRHETPGTTFKNHGKLWRGSAPFRSFSCYFG